MSQESRVADKRAQVEAVIDALNARDFDALGDMPFHPDMELRSVIAAVEGGVYYGLHGLREWAKDLDSTFDDFRVQLVEFREVGAEGAFAVLQNAGKAKASGIPLQAGTHVVCRWRNGLMWRLDSYTDRSEALEAVGLSEPAMSEENVEVVRAAYESFNAGAVEEWVAAFHPDVEVTARGVFPGIDTNYRGHAGVKRLRESVLEAWESFRIEPNAFAEQGDCVDVAVNLVGKGKGSGVDVSLTFHHAFLLRNGVVVHWALFPTRAEALAAVGLSE